MSTSAEALKRDRADVCAWAEANVWLKNPGTGQVGPLKLADHQRVWLTEATRRESSGQFVYKTCVASWPKREAKSTSAALLAAWRMACFERQDIGVIANSERQAQSNVFDAVDSIFEDSPKLQGYIPDELRQTRKLTVPSLANVIECYPANWRTIQGRHFDVLCCDELHASDDGGKSFVFASNQTEALDAQVLVSSQAGAPVQINPVWRLYKAAEAGAPGVFFDYRTELTFPWVIARAKIAEAELLPGEYSYLWGNSWGATGLKLLAAADVETAAMDYHEPQTQQHWQQLAGTWGVFDAPFTLGVGLDRAGVGRTGDRTVWTVTVRYGPPEGLPQFRVVMCEVLPTGSEAEVMDCAGRTWGVFGAPTQTLFEYFGCSDLVDKVPGAVLVPASPQRQNGIFTRLHHLFQEGRIGFPAEAGIARDPKTGEVPGVLKSELLAFEYDAEREGATKFGTQATHDDAAYSLAWSCEAADLRVEQEQHEIIHWEDMVAMNPLLQRYERWLERAGGLEPMDPDGRLGAARLD